MKTIIRIYAYCIEYTMFLILDVPLILWWTIRCRFMTKTQCEEELNRILKGLNK